MDLWIVFLTGLTVGGLTCLAVQGGLLASVIASREQEDLEKRSKPSHTLLPVFSFISAKLISYAALGFLLGAFGSVLKLSQQAQISMQFLAGVYMVLVALNLFNAHPVFRFIIPQPPRFLAKLVRNKSKSKDIFAPAILGAMTIIIPCGTTLAMEALAISSGDPVSGALILATFVIGTIPLFFGIGAITSKLGDIYKAKFLKIAAVLVLYLGLTSLNGALVAWGSPFAVQNILSSLPASAEISQNDTPNTSPTIENGLQSALINVNSNGYSPKKIILKKGVSAKLTLKTNETYSCAIAFRIPSLRIGVNLKPSEERVLDLPPLKKGTYIYTCSMGMYTGRIEVI